MPITASSPTPDAAEEGRRLRRPVGAVFSTDPHGRLMYRPVIRPLIYTTVYGGNEYYECLQIMLASLIEFEGYHGNVAVFCDREENEVISYVPEALRHRLHLVKNCLPGNTAALRDYAIVF